MKANICLDIEVTITDEEYKLDSIDEVTKKIEKAVQVLDEVNSTDVMDIIY